MKIERIYLDLDGVLAGFVEGAAELFGFDYSPETWPSGLWDCAEAFGVDEDEFWATIHNAGAEFWATLPQLPHYGDLVELAHLFADHPPAIVTKPSSDASAYLGKAQWLDERLWSLPGDAFFCSEKHHLAKPGRVLIDDSFANCEAWEKAGGQAILFPAPWNHRARAYCRGQAVAMVRSELEVISARRFGREPGIETA